MPIHDWTRLEGIFHDIHSSWIAELRKALNRGVLPPDYSALSEAVLGGMHPDVLTLRDTPPSNGTVPPGEAPAQELPGTVAVATSPPQVRLRQLAVSESYTRQQRRLVIRHRGGERVVAIIEIVSPSNKGSDYTLGQFVDKTLAALHRGIHVLILDLMPPGKRDPQGIHGVIWSQLAGEAYTAPPEAQLTLVSYSAGAMKEAFVEPTAVGRTLIPMPLFLSGERYVNVPLEGTYQEAYAGTSAGYRRILEA